MATFQLRLTPRTSPPRAADAWYLASSDPARWLAEVASWPAEHAKVSIVPLPSCQHDLTPAGALLIPPAGGIVADRHCIAFAQAAPNIYIPADADVFPPLEPKELAELFTGDYIHVWRPGAGLTAAEPTEAIGVHDLLTAGPRSTRTWTRAEPGVAHPQRLIAIAPIAPLDLNALFEEGRDDIGADADQIEQLPESPNEPKSGPLRTGARAATIAAASALAALSRLIPRPRQNADNAQSAAGRAAKPRGAAGGGAGKFLKDQLNRIARSLSEARHKELNRLLHMLDQDPDKGLRYALPFSAALHRGRAAPGSRLGERLIEFSLRRLGGGGPADVWDVPADYQRRLQEKYRELANREIRLNRHRRAAYIFAELLGDYFSAAAALRDGRHFREAAIVYRDKLRRPLEAAKCFEDGGLWSEAVAEYEQLQMYEKIGDLYTRLEDIERATDAYRMTADVFRSRSDYLSAARLCEEKLRDANLAALDLETGWLNSVQPSQCMRALFELLGRQGQHAVAKERADELVVEAAELTRYVTIAGLLADVAGSYPDVSVREAAAEGATQVIGARLRGAAPSEAETLCHTLARLAPEDRLLDRDARRYINRSRPTVRPALPMSRGALEPLRIINKWTFSGPADWQAAVVGDKTLLVAGLMHKRIVLARSTLDGHTQSSVVPWPKVPVRSEVRLLVVGDPGRGDRLDIYPVGEPPLPALAAYPRTDLFPEPLITGSLTGVSAAYGAARDTNGQTWIIEDRSGGAVVLVGDSSELIATHRLPVEAAAGDGEIVLPIPMLARQQRLYIGLGTTLITLQSGQPPQSQELPSTIGALAGTAPHTLNRIAVSLEVGACLIWDGAGHHQTRPFADDMSQPVVGFNRGGYVIAASGRRFEVYDTKNGRLTLVAGDSLDKSSVLSVFPLPEPNRFGLFDAAGNAIVYELGRRS